MTSLKRKFKTVKKLTGLKLYRKWPEYDIGDIVIGKYVGTHEDQYKKVCPVIEVYDAQFKDGSGENFIGKALVLNVCGTLSKALTNVTVGKTIQLEYQGQSTIMKGLYKGKPAHNMEVNIVEEGEENEEEISEEEEELL